MASFVFNVYSGTDGTTNLNCYYQFYHYDTNKLSNIRQSSEYQISFDSDDADINNQAAPFKSGDVGLLIMWTGNENRLNSDLLLDQFSVFKIDGDGSDVYSQSVYLYHSIAPTGVINVDDDIVDNVVNVTTTSSDEYLFSEYGLFRHKSSWYGITIFPQVQVFTTSYDFGLGYGLDAFNTYIASGTYTIFSKITNKYLQETILTKEIKIYNIPPIITLGCSPVAPKKDEEYTLSTVEENMVYVSSVTYYMNDIVITNDDFINSFSEIVSNEFKAVVIYNNGFELVPLTFIKNINMTKVPPNIVLTNRDIENIAEDDTYTFTSEITKGDGDLKKITYNLFLTLPFNNTLQHLNTQIKDINESSDYTDLLNIDFTSTGNYKITVEVEDSYGKISQDENIIDVTCAGNTSVISSKSAVMYFDNE